MTLPIAIFIIVASSAILLCFSYHLHKAQEEIDKLIDEIDKRDEAMSNSCKSNRS